MSALLSIWFDRKHASLTDVSTPHVYGDLAIASGSTSLNLEQGSVGQVSLNPKSFYPKIQSSSSNKCKLTNAYNGHFAIYNDSGAPQTYNIYWDYITGTKPPAIYVIQHKDNLIVWESDDEIEDPILLVLPDGTTVKPVKVEISEDKFKKLKNEAKKKGMLLAEYYAKFKIKSV